MNRLFSIVLTTALAGVASAQTPSLSGPTNATGGFGDRAVLINQPNNGNSNRISQDFPNNSSFSTYSFDDFTLSQTTTLTALTFYGTELGDSSQNRGMLCAITTGPSASGGILAVFNGSQIGDNLIFNLGGITLTSGTYWLTAFVVRDSGPAGQWLWNTTGEPVSGSEAFVHNPGGGFGFGTSPVAGSTVFPDGAKDMAFALEGEIVPTPGSLALLGVGGLLARRRRR
jgi:hypothetical protein